MKITSAFLLCLVGAANGWVLSPRRACIKRRIKKSIVKKGLLISISSAAAVGVTTAVGAAVVYNQINNREVYEPATGSMSEYFIVLCTHDMHDMHTYVSYIHIIHIITFRLSIDNQVVLITGGSSGLGLETAKRLAAAGATVVLTSRSEDKGQIAVESVKDYLIGKGVDTSNVYNLSLDLDSLENVKQFADSYKELELGDISVLVNNAGVMAIPEKELTIDGNERTFQSNHLGHFVLTAELFPYLSQEGAKVITVSSSASNFAAPGLDIDNLNAEKSYGAWSSYGTSKLANILFTKELQRKADEAGLDWLTAVTLHPGVVNTDLWRYIVGEEKLAKIKEQDTVSLESLALSATSLFTKTPEQGASTQVFLASNDDLVKGAFYDEMKEKTNLPAFAKDEAKAKALWDVSEELAGIKFDLAQTAEIEIVDSTTEADEEEATGNKAEEEDVSVEDTSDEDTSAAEDVFIEDDTVKDDEEDEE